MKLKSRINPEIERKLKDAIFVGRLATVDDLIGTPLNEPIYFKHEFQEDIQFHIKCLSAIPKEVEEHFYYPNNIITGSTISSNNRIKLNDWIELDHLYHFEKKDEIKKLLDGKLIAFTLNVKPEIVYIELVQLEDVIPSERGYAVIPSPELKLNERKTDFEHKIVDVRRPFTLKHYPHIFNVPKFLYFEGTLYDVTLNTSLNSTTYTQHESAEVMFDAHINEVFIDLVDMRIDDHLYFVPHDKMLTLEKRMKEKALSLNEQHNVEKALEDHAERSSTLTDKDDKKEESTSSAPKLDMKAESLVKIDSKEKQARYNKKEIHFIEQLHKNAMSRGLYFAEDDLTTFHISAKTNLLTVIGGMSGTGKSQLAKLYGETMGLQYGNELLMIPVSPSYHEPNDLLGYLNPTTGVYHESETALVSLLLEAEKSPERMFMVIFDEMNLSQIEHWFSPFISLLELDEEERYLTLYNDNSYCVNDKYKAQVKIGNNVIFVGTVNFDETTKDFSDRLLDRTNVIVPEKLSFTESLQLSREQQISSDDFESLNIHTSIFRDNWINKKREHLSLESLTEAEITLLDHVHQLLNDSDKQKGISFRVAIGIANFLSNIPVTEEGDSLINREHAFDMQFSQRILTKLKGISPFVAPLVGYYENEQFEEGDLAALLKSDIGQAVSSFDISYKHLKNKAKELILYGYAK